MEGIKVLVSAMAPAQIPPNRPQRPETSTRFFTCHELNIMKYLSLWSWFSVRFSDCCAIHGWISTYRRMPTVEMCCVAKTFLLFIIS